MNIGDILRQRLIRSYYPNPHNYYEIAPDMMAGGSAAVYVTMLLGTEDMHLIASDGSELGVPLNIELAMNRLGWWSEHQIIDALGKTGNRTMDRIREHAAANRTDIWDEPDTGETDPLFLSKPHKGD